MRYYPSHSTALTQTNRDNKLIKIYEEKALAEPNGRFYKQENIYKEICISGDMILS